MGAGAILVAGMADTPEENSRYANDLVLWRELVTSRFGASHADVQILYLDGGSSLGEAATLDNLAAAFARSSDTIEENDPFFLVVTNHGYPVDADPARCKSTIAPPGRFFAWPETSVFPEDISEMAADLKSRRQAFVFGQCGAGAFSELASEHRAVLCACLAHQASSALPSLPWDEFLYNVADALGARSSGKPPSGNLRDAFHRAKAQSSADHEGCDGESPLLCDPGDVASRIVVRAYFGQYP
ncbi:MAG: hypothetical protein AABZ30_10030 [Myxococcota bacterium]